MDVFCPGWSLSGPLVNNIITIVIVFLIVVPLAIVIVLTRPSILDESQIFRL